jgi:hypothetical protein
MASQWRDLTAEQRRVAGDLIQLYEHHLELAKETRELAGGMFWKTVKTREYLVRSLDRHGHIRSLGPRSAQTEALYREFTARKKDVRLRSVSVTSQLRRRAKFCVAADVNRVPAIPADVARVLDGAGLLGTHLLLLGSHALYAYEIAAGVQFKTGLLQTDDLDALIDPHSPLEIAVRVRKLGLLGLLKTVDRSFAPAREPSFRAVNAKGFMVELLRPVTVQPGMTGLPSIGMGKDLIAQQLIGLDWILAGPKFSQIVIAENGFPARFVVPDPRVFALHKIWLSLQPTRNPMKRKRDFRQGEAVAQLAIEYLNLSFEDSALRALPIDLTAAVPALLARLRSRKPTPTEAELPPGFDDEESG